MSEWNQLLDELVPEIPDLAEEFVVEFRKRGLYETVEFPDAEIYDTAVGIFTELIGNLRDSEDGDAVQSTRSMHLFSRSRVGRGIDLDELLSAIRIDFIVLWRALNRHTNDQNKAVLIDNAERVHFAVEDFTAAARQAFLEEQERVRSEKQRSTQRLLDRLIAAPALSDAAIVELAEGLGVNADAEFTVLTVNARFTPHLESCLHDIRPARGVSSAMGIFVLGAMSVVWPTRSENAPHIHDLRARLTALGVTGISRTEISGLKHVRETVRFFAPLVQGNPIKLASMSEHLEAGIITDAVDAWPSVMGAVSEQLLPGLIAEKVVSLQALGPKELEHLLETVNAYFELGSIKAVATRTYCHRNTVVNRLKAFESVTGLSPTVPRDCAMIELVLAAFKTSENS